MLRTIVIMSIALAGCVDKAAEDKAMQDAVSAEIADIQKRTKELDDWEKRLADKEAQSAPVSKPTPVKAAVAADPELQEGWCYKDYCPCEPNPDNDAAERLHCDMMQAGADIDERLLAVARGNREVRRQLRTGDY